MNLEVHVVEALQSLKICLELYYGSFAALHCIFVLVTSELSHLAGVGSEISLEVLDSLLKLRYIVRTLGLDMLPRLLYLLVELILLLFHLKQELEGASGNIIFCGRPIKIISLIYYLLPQPSLYFCNLTMVAVFY